MLSIDLGKAFQYHIILMIPLLLVLYLFNVQGISAIWLGLYGFIDVLLYRPFLNKIRLESLGIFDSGSYWRRVFVIPFKYYTELMFMSK